MCKGPVEAAGCRPGIDPPLSSSSSCSSGCPSCSFPVTSKAVTVRGSFVVGRDVIRLPYFQSCSSAPDVNAMEVKGKEHDGQPDEQEEGLHRGGWVPGLHPATSIDRLQK